MNEPFNVVSVMLYPARLMSHPDGTVVWKGDVVPEAPLACNVSMSVDTLPPQSARNCAVTLSPAAGEST